MRVKKGPHRPLGRSLGRTGSGPRRSAPIPIGHRPLAASRGPCCAWANDGKRSVPKSSRGGLLLPSRSEPGRSRLRRGQNAGCCVGRCRVTSRRIGGRFCSLCARVLPPIRLSARCSTPTQRETASERWPCSTGKRRRCRPPSSTTLPPPARHWGAPRQPPRCKDLVAVAPRAVTPSEP